MNASGILSPRVSAPGDTLSREVTIFGIPRLPPKTPQSNYCMVIHALPAMQNQMEDGMYPFVRDDDDDYWKGTRRNRMPPQPQPLPSCHTARDATGQSVSECVSASA